MFDPFDKYENHEYHRFWFHWKQCEDLAQKRQIRQRYEMSKKTGTLKNFEQEYNAKFTVDEEAFFEDADIVKGIDPTLALEYSWKKSPCSLAVDYGQTKSATTLTVKTKLKNVIITLWQWGAFDFDENLLMEPSFEHSIPKLFERYDIKYLITDDCAQGYRTNKQLEDEGYPLRKFYFSRGTQLNLGEKNKAYYNYRGALRKGQIKYPDIRELIVEMKALMEIRMKVTTSIQKPVGGTDDRIDGEVMASMPFIEEEGDFGAELVFPAKAKKYLGNPARHDEQWDGIQDFIEEKKEAKQQW